MKTSEEFRILNLLRADAKAAGLTSKVEIIKALFLNAGYSSTVIYRLQSFLSRPYLYPLAKFLSRMNLFFNSIDFVIGSSIKGGLKVIHPAGIVIGNKVIAGSFLTVMQNVTIGQKDFASNSEASTANPIIGDSVSIGANSVLLGDIFIGSGSIIGAGTIVTKSVPSGSLVTGNPAVIEKKR